MTKKQNLEKEIGVKQLNPKWRLFLLIFFNWLVNLYPILWIIAYFLVPDLRESHYLFAIGILAFLPVPLFHRFWIMSIGVEYFPKDLQAYYVRKNESQLQKFKNLEINHVTQQFNVIPICDEAYSKRKSFDSQTKEEFVKLSWIEESQNRLVVNGKIDNLPFSWGVVTKMKKNRMKIFWLSFLYLGPIGGIITSLVKPKLTDSSLLSWSTRKHHQIGCLDLFPKQLGKLNSENYLIFAAKIQNQTGLITLIPEAGLHQSAENQYHWPINLSNFQKTALENLMKEWSFLPSIYLDHDNISIVMKKYDYNAQDNQELQTWELLKEANSNSEIQFQYLDQAIKIYQIFNHGED